jgi:ribosomal protein L37AE/L43A
VYRRCGRVACYKTSGGCEFDHSITQKLSNAGVNTYVGILTQLAFKAKEDMEALESSKDEGFVKQTSKNLQERLSNLFACPHCHTVYYDFEGCLALKCHSCLKEFCGICHTKAIAMGDVHDCVGRHLAAMSTEMVKRYSAYELFMSSNGWKLWRSDRQFSEMFEFLISLNPQTVEANFDELMKTFSSHIISASEVERLRGKLAAEFFSTSSIRQSELMLELKSLDVTMRNATIEDLSAAIRYHLLYKHRQRIKVIKADVDRDMQVDSLAEIFRRVGKDSDALKNALGEIRFSSPAEKHELWGDVLEKFADRPVSKRKFDLVARMAANLVGTERASLISEIRKDPRFYFRPYSPTKILVR